MSADLLEQLGDYRHTLDSAIHRAEIGIDGPRMVELAEPFSPLEVDVVVELMPEPPAPTLRDGMIGRVLAAAAAAAIVVLVIVSSTGENLVETEQATTGTSGTDALTSIERAPGTAEALAVVDEFFAANEAADFDAMRALFTPDALFSSLFTIAGDEALFAWNAAQGTTITAPDCVANEPHEGSVLVRCTFFNRDALVQAIDGPPVPINLNLRVGLDGITEEAGDYGDPDFNTVGAPFEAWMFNHHPDDRDKTGFGDWASVAEAERNGLLVARYAGEWADFLVANGCGYLDGC